MRTANNNNSNNTTKFYHKVHKSNMNEYNFLTLKKENEIPTNSYI